MLFSIQLNANGLIVFVSLQLNAIRLIVMVLIQKITDQHETTLL